MTNSGLFFDSHRSYRLIPMEQAHVMIVEDQMDNLITTRRLLLFSGILMENIIQKVSGDGVVQFAEYHEQIDLILLDLRLPHEDGYEILRNLRSRTQFEQTRVVAITGKASLDEMNKARAAGFDGFIGKPLELNRFPDQLRRILNNEEVWEWR